MIIIEDGAKARETLAEYQARGGYAGLARGVDNGPAWLLGEVRRAGLRGRGASGEGRPVAAKWAQVAHALRETRYVVANGAESSPVSQKDRHLMAFFPHRVLEGLLAAAFAVSAGEVYIYVRGDSEEAVAGVEAAVAEAREAGLFGPGTSLPVDVHIQTAIPGYIAGEETAVIDALEGLEGLPQPKPPRPEEIGLRGNPTSVNNVESLAAVAAILRRGVDEFRSYGTPDCPGTALFTVSGDVTRAGVFEVPYGTQLSTLLAMAGAPPREELLTVLPGGLSSGPLTPDELDVSLTYESLAAVGSTVGPAAVVVVRKSDDKDMMSLAAETTLFLAEASCGQCRGCKEGTKALAEAFAAGDRQQAGEWARLLVNGRGNCAHPAGAARFALRALQQFPADKH